MLSNNLLANFSVSISISVGVSVSVNVSVSVSVSVLYLCLYLGSFTCHCSPLLAYLFWYRSVCRSVLHSFVSTNWAHC